MAAEALPPRPLALITSLPSNSDFFNFPQGFHGSPSGASLASLASNSAFYNFPPGPLQHRSPSSVSVSSLASHSAMYNFPPGLIQHRSSSSASVVSLASQSGFYNFPPGSIHGSASHLSLASSSNKARAAYPQGSLQASRASRASMASMASIAESTGTQDEILDEDFSPRAVQCFTTPEASPHGSAAQKTAVARV